MAYLMMLLIARTILHWTARRSVATACCKMLFSHVSGNIAENHEKPQQVYFVPWLRSEPGTFWKVSIKCYHLNQLAQSVSNELLQINTHKFRSLWASLHKYSEWSKGQNQRISDNKNRVDLSCSQQWLWWYYLLNVTLYKPTNSPTYLWVLTPPSSGSKSRKLGQPATKTTLCYLLATCLALKTFLSNVGELNYTASYARWYPHKNRFVKMERLWRLHTRR
jgi:hypothetical protein